MKRIFRKADILLPALSTAEEFTRWSVIACDQFTSEPEYWERVKAAVGDSPSALHLILPEVYLKEADDKKTHGINGKMALYRKELLREYRDSLVYVERTQSDGRLRRGVIGVLDLEEYDYAAYSVSPIRATEGTVLDRIPPRVRIRENAPLEIPHIMVLINDPEKTVEKLLSPLTGSLPLLYDFELMLGGGHLRGYRLSGEIADRTETAINGATVRSGHKHPVLFAMGDGNHSLASAKAHYENLKHRLGEDAAKKHPARFALCEIVNIHDGALTFEPIYRVVFHVDPDVLIRELRAYVTGDGETEQSVRCITATAETELAFGRATHPLTVGTLQNFLDEYVQRHPEAEVDYIHGEASLLALANQPNAIGFLFRGMEKSELFPAVETGGALPRKTFSMGHAEDKRYYTEARAIR